MVRDFRLAVKYKSVLLNLNITFTFVIVEISSRCKIINNEGNFKSSCHHRHKLPQARQCLVDNETISYLLRFLQIYRCYTGSDDDRLLGAILLRSRDYSGKRLGSWAWCVLYVVRISQLRFRSYRIFSAK